MSDLRKRVDAARAAHRAARYPGDLAADVLGPETSSSLRRVVLQAGVVAAAAAAVVLLALRMPTAPEQSGLDGSTLRPPPSRLSIVFPALAVPQPPAGFDVAVAMPSFDSPVPNVPCVEVQPRSILITREPI